MPKKRLPQLIDVVVTVFIFLPLLEANFFAVRISESYLFFLAAWLVFSFYFRLSSRVTFSLSVTSLFFTLVALWIGNFFVATRLAIWFYLFFFEGLVLQCFERYSHRKSMSFALSQKKAIQLVTISPLFAFFTVMKHIIFRSKLLFVVFIFFWISLITYQLHNQAKYFYWFFYFDKLSHFVFQTLIFEAIVAALLLVLLVRLAIWLIDIRLLLTVFVVFIFFSNTILYFFTTRSITVQGDIPIISQVQKIDNLVAIWGHNFRLWPNHMSGVFLDDQKQEVVYWSDVLIVIQPSERTEPAQLSITSPLEFTSNKYRVNLN